MKAFSGPKLWLRAVGVALFLSLPVFSSLTPEFFSGSDSDVPEARVSRGGWVSKSPSASLWRPRDVGSPGKASLSGPASGLLVDLRLRRESIFPFADPDGAGFPLASPERPLSVTGLPGGPDGDRPDFLWADESSPAEEVWEKELLDLEAGFEQAYLNLFADRAYGVLPLTGNPFQDRMIQGGADLDPSPGGQARVSDAPRNDDSRLGDSPTNSFQGRTTPDGASPDRTERDPNAVLIGELGGPGTGMSAMAARREENGDFILENSQRVSIFWGAIKSVLLFPETQQVVTLDFDGDGLMDIFATHVHFLGTTVVLYRNTGSGAFQQEASGFLPGAYVTGVAPFDVSGNGELDFVFTAEGVSTLVVYQRRGRNIDYLKELALPFAPGLVVDSPNRALFQDPRLYVFDRALEQSLALVSRRGVISVFPSKFPATRAQSLSLDYQGSGVSRAEVIVLEDALRIVLFERQGPSRTPSLYASFDRRLVFPLAVIGDFEGRRVRQTAIIP